VRAEREAPLRRAAANGDAAQQQQQQQQRAALSMRTFVASLRQGAASGDGARAMEALAALQPAEAVGVACWYLDELAAGADPQHAPLLGRLLDDAAALAAAAARTCVGRAPRPPSA
jgi:hypothetical protein